MRSLVIFPLLAILAVAAGRDTAAQDPGKDTASARPVSIRMVEVVRPNIELVGSHLSRVEIWMEPTGTGAGEALVGRAKRTTHSGDHERWVFPISSLPGYPHPVMATGIVAVGYNSKGREVGRKSLNVSGVTDLNKALYGKIPE